MRHVRMLGLVVIAVLAVMAIAATAASAGKPEWGQCYAKPGGKYANSNCTTKAKKGSGTYEWRTNAEVPKRGFTGAGGRGLLYTNLTACANTCVNQKGEVSPEGKEKIEDGTRGLFAVTVECSSEAATGEASSKRSVKDVNVTFKGCQLAEEFPCSNTANSGEIKTNVLKGELGIISKKNNEVGVSLTPETKKGAFAKFECAGILGTEVGIDGKHEGPPGYPPKGGGDAIISPITPINEMTTSFTQEYKTTGLEDGRYCHGCYNLPEKFENKSATHLEAYVYGLEKPEDRGFWEPAGEEITNVNTPEEPVEIKA